MATTVGAVPTAMDEKARRTRDLLASFYNTDPAAAGAVAASPARPSPAAVTASPLESINSTSFNPDVYMDVLVQQSNLEALLQRHVKMAAEIKNLDTDLQMLVYENYNKFISATDTIKRMKTNIAGMETNMEQLLSKITSVQSRSDTVNTSLFNKRENIEKLHRTRNLLRKVQFIYDLPSRLNKCIKAEAYADAVRFFTGAKPIFEAYGDTSFQDCKKASEEAMDLVIQQLQAKLYSDSEPIEARAEAVVLLKQLNFPVDNLKSNLLEKLEDCLLNLQTEPTQASVGDISKTFRAYLIIFPDSESRLIELAHALFTNRYETVRGALKERIPSTDLLAMLRGLWEDATAIDEVISEAALPAFSLETTRDIIKQHIATAFLHLQTEISDVLVRTHSTTNEKLEESQLQTAMEKSKIKVSQGCIDLLQEFRHLIDGNTELLVQLKDLIIDWVQEGFQDFFQKLDGHFHMLSGRITGFSQESSTVDFVQIDKVPTVLVLMLAQLCVFIEQTTIPKVTEDLADSFSGGGARSSEYGPPFVPGEICRLYRSSGEKFLQHYINIKTQKISKLLNKRFSTPVWLKHKEPREVNMFVDLLLLEFNGIVSEVKQILPGLVRRHRHSDSTGSTTSSRSNPMREEMLHRSNTNRSRSQFLENHLAKLFEQKMEIFTKLEYTQESVISTVLKLCLKSLQEFVRLQTFNRSGFQQIQLDMEFLKSSLKEFIDDEAAISFLLKEVNNAAHERCLDPIPLEAPILDKLINAKLAKIKEQSSNM
ncbi:vacuolar protein sorting-associated protein 51 homolog [Hordeum vulgare subsp. vulgare]|uniref:Vacuolar protein sorting-associated protein 51 homolog n=1 Tax=Hordeum vulgare subsp. vulgare TaxID=112509 RepID=A0A8I6XCF1_HORVV|nr:vacuolar protein sorting-associated protein 51 homolog [Hordeum vulgare subsp. vulgare]